ncbi:hypothetical protein D3C71_2198500 [compost metagenome]
MLKPNVWQPVATAEVSSRRTAASMAIRCSGASNWALLKPTAANRSWGLSPR